MTFLHMVGGALPDEERLDGGLAELDDNDLPLGFRVQGSGFRVQGSGFKV